MPTRSIARIERATLTFLADLEKHNDRDWFTANKERYQAAHANMADFAEALIARMNKHDHIIMGERQGWGGPVAFGISPADQRQQAG